MLRLLRMLSSFLVTGPTRPAGTPAPPWWPVLIAALGYVSASYFGTPLCP